MVVLTSAKEIHAALHASLDELVSVYLKAAPPDLTWDWSGEADYDEERLTLDLRIQIRPRPTVVP